MYNGDTFFHLSVPGQIGLVALSLTLSISLIWFHLKLSSRFGTAVKVLLAVVLIWAFIWLSPQIYYLYYIQIIPGLGLQNVIADAPTVTEVISTITFTGKANLSEHSKGLLFWMMIVFGLLKRRRKPSPTTTDRVETQKKPTHPDPG